MGTVQHWGSFSLLTQPSRVWILTLPKIWFWPQCSKKTFRQHRQWTASMPTEMSKAQKGYSEMIIGSVSNSMQIAHEDISILPESKTVLNVFFFCFHCRMWIQEVGQWPKVFRLIEFLEQPVDFWIIFCNNKNLDSSLWAFPTSRLELERSRALRHRARAQVNCAIKRK